MGASLLWNSRKEKDASFPLQSWMLKITEESCSYLKFGNWDWETGMNRDQLMNFEYVRDYEMLAVYCQLGVHQEHWPPQARVERPRP